MSALARQARVVVVDDEPALAAMFAQYLADRFKVEWFTSSPLALDHLRASRADLLVTDLLMPQMHGLELTGLAKEHQPALKVVMISALDPWAWCRGSHPSLSLLDAFLPKPVALNDLEQCCGRLLRGSVAPRDKRGPYLTTALAY